MVYTVEDSPSLVGYQVYVYLSPTDGSTLIHRAYGFKTREEARVYGEWWISDSD